MSDGNDPALLDHAVTGIHRLMGVPEAIAYPPGHLQTKRNAEWVRSQFDADPDMRREYLQAAVMHPHVFQNDEATIVSNVETVVGHFAADGLTRSDYFKVLAAEPLLLRQKPAAIISDVESGPAVTTTADQPMRTGISRRPSSSRSCSAARPRRFSPASRQEVDRSEAQGVTPEQPPPPGRHAAARFQPATGGDWSTAASSNGPRLAHCRAGHACRNPDRPDGGRQPPALNLRSTTPPSTFPTSDQPRDGHGRQSPALSVQPRSPWGPAPYSL